MAAALAAPTSAISRELIRTVDVIKGSTADLDPAGRLRARRSSGGAPFLFR